MKMLHTTKGALVAGSLLYLLIGGLTWLILHGLGVDAPLDMSSDVPVEKLMERYQLASAIGLVASILIVVLPGGLTGWLSPAKPKRTALLFATVAVVIQVIAWLLWLLLGTHQGLETTVYRSVGLIASMPLQFAVFFVATVLTASLRQRQKQRVEPNS